VIHKVIAVCVCVTLLVSCAIGGDLKLTITDLDGAPRAGEQIDIELFTRAAGEQVKSSIKTFTKTTGTGAASGQVTIPLPDKKGEYPNDSNEMFVKLDPDSPILEEIEIPFLLGRREIGPPVDHTMVVVIRRTPSRAPATEFVAVYRGRYGTFVLPGETGSAFFRTIENRQQVTKIVSLTESNADNRFVYYSEEGSDREWAFARRSRDGRCFNVWSRSSIAPWTFYESVTRIEPTKTKTKAK